jgi:hypothetical protein
MRKSSFVWNCRSEGKRLEGGATNLGGFPADRTQEAARVQVEIYRRMPSSKRLELALHMSDWLRKVVAAGVRQRPPEFSEEQVRLAVTWLYLGVELFAKAYPVVWIAV